MKKILCFLAGMAAMVALSAVRASGMAPMWDSETAMVAEAPAAVVPAVLSAATVSVEPVADTMGLTWKAGAADETKTFSFEGTAGAAYVLYWGDGDSTRWRATGRKDAMSHRYAKRGTYKVLLCGLPADAAGEEPEDPSAAEVVAALERSMVYVAGGTFKMGRTPEQEDTDQRNNELPVHSVTLDDYYIGKFEVTQAQWQAVMGTNPSYFKGDALPVERVSWYDAVAFCEKLSAQTGKTYRLPTEAEWEYAARGGQYADGTKYAGSDDLDAVAWYRGNSDGQTHAVGSKAPNGLGLYDMSGNVWEWCSDWYGDYSPSSATNPQGPSGGSYRVFRGGGWSGDAPRCRVSSRYYGGPGDRVSGLGFRVVCEPEPEEEPDAAEVVAALERSMVYVAGGTFQMGCTAEQSGDCYDDETPVHSVTLDDYYIGKFEVTQAQWQAVMGTTVAQQRDKADASFSLYGVGDDYPMYYISWDDAVAFCEKLSALTGKTYRLPTEAEWEYAARGGQYADGTKYAGSDDLDAVAWYRGNSDGQTHAVGSKAPNGLGLYDMSGNVWEWCSDWYGDYSPSSATNPQGPSGGSFRVRRGGSWGSSASICRVSDRNYDAPGYRYYHLGFRVVCEL